MQSILQYRRFRKRLEQQLERHGAEKVAACTNHQSSLVARQSSTNESIQAHRCESDTPVEARDCALEEKEAQRDVPTDASYQENNTNLGQKSASSMRSPTLEITDKMHQVQDVSRPRSSSAQPPYCDIATGTADEGPAISLIAMQEDLSGSTIHSRSSRASSIGSGDNQMRTATTRGSTGTRLGQTLTGVNVRTRKTDERGPEGGKVFIVGFQGDDDPINPHNWPIIRRVRVTLLVALIGLIVGFASSVDSAVAQQAMKELGVSEVAESLATGIYLIGFGFGAFFAAPFSETVGRNPVYLVTMVLFMIFIMASALAPNIGAQLVFRFLAGFFGSTPLTCAGGSISDMWDATERTILFPVFANAAFWGPVLGPVIGGFIGESSALSWRWTEWITLIWTGLIFAMLVLFLPETYAPTLLKWKAHHLREITGDSRYMSSLEVQDSKFAHRLLHNIYRPFLMFAFEPIVVLFTLYLTVVYIVLFTFLTGFEFIFLETYDLSQGITFLIFVTLGIGFLFASALVPWVVKRYRSALHAANERGVSRLPPERRLVFAMIGAPFMPIGLFWMGWTAYPSISMWSPILACLPVGFAIMAIFISTYQYLIDAFETYAASALVGATFVRYVASGGMIPVSIPLYRNLGLHWTLTMLGCISALLAPVPYLFWFFGARVRKMSRYATDFS